jgi:hypothetical protein
MLQLKITSRCKSITGALESLFLFLVDRLVKFVKITLKITNKRAEKNKEGNKKERKIGRPIPNHKDIKKMQNITAVELTLSRSSGGRAAGPITDRNRICLHIESSCTCSLLTLFKISHTALW